jgi:kynurenine formamidase
LEATLATQGTELRRGDSVLVRTGWYAAHYKTDERAYFASQPGVGPDAALWLYDHGMALLGTDTSGTEVIPMPNLERTTHGLLLVERGVHLIEIMDLEAIAADRVYEFLFVCLPLRIKGATGSWVRPIAIV